MSLTEKRTQVYFPQELYRRVERKAKESSKSNAAIIREAVAEYLEKKEKEIDWDNDPIWRLVGIMESGVDDLSVNHDEYIYGKKARKRMDK